MKEQPTLQDYQEEVLRGFQIEYKESEQILTHTKDPQLLEFHQGRMDYLRPLLKSAGVIFDGDQEEEKPQT